MSSSSIKSSSNDSIISLDGEIKAIKDRIKDYHKSIQKYDFTKDDKLAILKENIKRLNELKFLIDKAKIETESI
jgi:hypothetical protein